LGFLPGTVDEKIAPYMEGYTSNMAKIIGEDTVKKLIEKKGYYTGTVSIYEK
jgi:phosphate starvation-inducible protein PhoH